MGIFSFIGNAYTAAIDTCTYRAQKKSLYTDGLGNKVLIALGTVLNGRAKASGAAVAKKTMAELREQRPTLRVVTPSHALEPVYVKSAQRLDSGDVRLTYSDGATTVIDPSRSLPPTEPPRQAKQSQDYGALARLEFRLLDEEGEFKPHVTDNYHARRHMVDTISEVVQNDIRDRETAQFVQLMESYSTRLDAYLSRPAKGNVVRLTNGDRKVAMTLDAIARFRADYHRQNDRVRSFKEYLLNEIGGRDASYVKPEDMRSGAFVTRNGTIHYDVLYAALKNDQQGRTRLITIAEQATPWSLADEKRRVA